MHANFTTYIASPSDSIEFPEFLDHTFCYNIFNNNKSCDIKDTVYYANTVKVDGNNKKELLSCCNDFFESSFLSYFIHRDYKKSVVFEDPLKIKDIIGFSVSTETEIPNLLCDYKSLLEDIQAMTLINSHDENFTSYRNLYMNICTAIQMEDHQEFEKLLRIPSLASILHAQDLQGRSILTLACIMDKPRIAELLLKKGLSLDDKDNLGRTALYWAVKCDSTKVLEWMLNQLPVTEDFILSKDDQGITSLHLAAIMTSSKILCLLLDALPDKSESLLRKIFDGYNRLPLHYAVASGSLECVREFMDKDLGLPVNIRDMYGNTLLMLACGNNSASDVVRYLSTKKSISATSRNSYGMSALHVAVLANNIESVKILLEEWKIPTEIYDEDARTPLHYAAQNGRLEIVELLLRNGARYDGCDKYRATPLHYAAEISWPIVISLTAKSPYNYCGMTDKEGRTPFMWAVASENEEIVSEMLKTFDIPRHGKDNHYYTPLHLAAFTGNLSIYKILLLQGWTVSVEDKAGATPLHIAAGKGFIDIVEICCTSDDILVKIDTNQRTALFYAALGGQTHTLDVMISDLRFDKMAKDILDRTVLHVAAYCGFVGCVKKLIDHGVEINASDKDEETPLHLACSRDKEDVVHLLVNSGATINRYSRVNGTTPLCYAIANKNFNLIQYLRNRDAVTGREIKDTAASIVTRAIRGYIVKKRQCLLGASSGSTIQFPEQSLQNNSRLPNQRVYSNNSFSVATRSLTSSQFTGTSIPNRQSSHSADSNIYIDGTLIDILDF